MTFSVKSAAVTLGFLLMACGGASSSSNETTAAPELRSITNAEALSDFDQIAESFRSLYGAMDRKQAKYGFDFEAMVTDYRGRVAKANNESDYKGIYQEFISRFNDAHVSLFYTLDDDASNTYYTQFRAMPIEDTYVVYAVAPNIDLHDGEELLALDGVSAKDLAAQYSKYQGVPNDLTRKHFASDYFSYRPGYLSKGLDPNTPQKLTVKGLDGKIRDVSMPWVHYPNLLPPATPGNQVAPQAGQSRPRTLLAASSRTSKIATAELSKFGARVPFFMTPQVKDALGITGEVTPSPASLVKYGVTADAAAALNYFAVKYFLNGKKVLLIRLPSYEPDDTTAALGYLKALFADQQSQVDGLILDQTHNPGGSINFAENVVSLLAKTQANGYVQRMHADRSWIGTYADYASQVQAAAPTDPLGPVLLADARNVDDAYSNNRSLSGPIPFFNATSTIDPDADHWTKPVMMLADELSVSCADLVPLMFKANRMGQLFGQTTMGGGGNVEQVATLTHTQGTLSISRGVGTVFDPTGVYPESTIIEDNGVAPTYAYSHTLADYRAGYIGYVSAFNTLFKGELGAQLLP